MVAKSVSITVLPEKNYSQWCRDKNPLFRSMNGYFSSPQLLINQINFEDIPKSKYLNITGLTNQKLHLIHVFEENISEFGRFF
jgi:hypothetical protein